MKVNEIMGIDMCCPLCNPQFSDCARYTDFFNGLFLVTVGKKSFSDINVGDDALMIALKTFLLAEFLKRDVASFLKRDYILELGTLYGFVKEAANNADINDLCARILGATKTPGCGEFFKNSLMFMIEVVDARGKAIDGAA